MTSGDDVRALLHAADATYAASDFAEASQKYMKIVDMLKPAIECADFSADAQEIHDHAFRRVMAVTENHRKARARGAELVRQKLYEEAVSQYTLAHTFVPGDSVALANRSLCHLRLGKHDAALADAKAAVERDKNSAKARYREGMAAQALGQHAMAVSALEAAVSLEPGNSQLVEALQEAQEAQVSASVDMDTVVGECSLFNPPGCDAHSAKLQAHIERYLANDAEFSRVFFQLMLPSARRQTASRVDKMAPADKMALMDDFHAKYRAVMTRRAKRMHTRIRLDITPDEIAGFGRLLSHEGAPSRAALSATLGQRLPNVMSWEPRRAVGFASGDLDARRDRAEWQHLDPWYRLCYNAVADGKPEGQVYEVLTQEFVQSLARYLHSRAKDLQAEDGDSCNQPILLEVGAGDGRLSALLRDELRQLASVDAARRAPPPELTDGGFESALLSLSMVLEPDPDPDVAPLWDMRCADAVPGLHSPLFTLDASSPRTHPGVEMDMLDHAAAVQKHAPKLVLCSWMPGGEDWTSCWRSQESVREYVLIGVPDSGMCGNEWRTWGCGRGDDTLLSPAEQEGWERVDIHAVSRWQLCCLDRPSFEETGCSRCVSFRRVA